MPNFRRTKSKNHSPYVAATLDEIAVEIGVSRERVRQIIAAALNKLRRNPVLREQYAHIIDRERLMIPEYVFKDEKVVRAEPEDVDTDFI